MRPSTNFDEVAQGAYDHFHATLFDGLLPECRVSFQEEIDGRLGFAPGPRRGGGGNRIVLHFGFFSAVDPAHAMQVLVHEMLHLWQFHFGQPAQQLEHNAEFARKSIAIGLMPSSTGGKGGERTGPVLIDYIMPKSKFDRALAQIGVTWEQRFPGAKWTRDPTH